MGEAHGLKNGVGGSADDKQNLVGRQRTCSRCYAAIPQPLMRPICLIRVVHFHPRTPPPPPQHTRSLDPLLRVIYTRTVTVGEREAGRDGGEQDPPHPNKTEIKKKCNTSTFSSAPFIIIQKLVFNAMSSSNHVRVCMIQILS